MYIPVIIIYTRNSKMISVKNILNDPTLFFSFDYSMGVDEKLQIILQRKSAERIYNVS